MKCPRKLFFESEGAWMSEELFGLLFTLQRLLLGVGWVCVFSIYNYPPKEKPHLLWKVFKILWKP